MGYFDLPRGEFELLMKKKGRGCYKPEWRSVMFTDRLDPESIVMTVEDWSKHYKVLAARYNGKAVTIPEKYHWEHRVKGEVLGVYESWDGVKAAIENRKRINRSKPKGERASLGLGYCVLD